MPLFRADRPLDAAHRVPGLGVAHELDVGATSSHRPEVRTANETPRALRSTASRMRQVHGAALALPLVRRAVVPHGVVDHELVATPEHVEERDRAVASDDLDRPVDLHHRQPAAAAARASPSRVCAFSRTRSSFRAACQVARSTTGGRPGSAVVGFLGVVVMASSVGSRAGPRRPASRDTRTDRRPGRNSSRRGIRPSRLGRPRVTARGHRLREPPLERRPTPPPADGAARRCRAAVLRRAGERGGSPSPARDHPRAAAAPRPSTRLATRRNARPTSGSTAPTACTRPT